MANGVRRRGDERRRQVLAEQRASGLSVAAFARERGLSAWTLYEWRRRLGAAQSEPVAKPELVQVMVTPSASRASTIAVELGAGLRVHVPSGFDAAELRRLLEVLASC